MSEKTLLVEFESIHIDNNPFKSTTGSATIQEADNKHVNVIHVQAFYPATGHTSYDAVRSFPGNKDLETSSLLKNAQGQDNLSLKYLFKDKFSDTFQIAIDCFAFSNLSQEGQIFLATLKGGINGLIGAIPSISSDVLAGKAIAGAGTAFISALTGNVNQLDLTPGTNTANTPVYTLYLGSCLSETLNVSDYAGKSGTLQLKLQVSTEQGILNHSEAPYFQPVIRALLDKHSDIPTLIQKLAEIRENSENPIPINKPNGTITLKITDISEAPGTKS